MINNGRRNSAITTQFVVFFHTSNFSASEFHSTAVQECWSDTVQTRGNFRDNFYFVGMKFCDNEMNAENIGFA